MCLSGVIICKISFEAILAPWYFLDPDHARAGVFSSIVAPRLSALHRRMFRRLSAALDETSAGRVGAMSATGANAKPVGPHHVWPTPVAPEAAKSCSSASTARLLNREPP